MIFKNALGREHCLRVLGWYLSYRKRALQAAGAELNWMVTHCVHVASFFFLFHRLRERSSFRTFLDFDFEDSERWCFIG